MRYGYSLLLGEIIEASRLEYGDCADFQITCPACREPVFKRVRNTGETETHYLAHYRAVDDNDVCELRVNSLSTEAINAANAVARGQQLSAFLSVLPEELLRATYPDNRESATRRIEEVLGKGAMKIFLASLHEHLANESAEQLVRSMWTTIGQLFTGQSAFWTDRNFDLASAVFAHLHTPPARPVFDFVGALSLLETIPLSPVSAADFAQRPDELNLQVVDLFSDIANKPASAALRAVIRAQSSHLKFGGRNYMKFDGKKRTVYRMAIDVIAWSMLDRLVQLPYPDILRRRQAERGLMEGHA